MDNETLLNAGSAYAWYVELDHDTAVEALARAYLRGRVARSFSPGEAWEQMQEMLV